MTNDNRHSTLQFTATGSDVAALSDTDILMPIADTASEHDPLAVKDRKRHVWPWVVLASVFIVMAAACGFGVWFFQSHVLPGTTLWGNSVTGKTQQEIADTINDQVKHTTVTAKYQGKSAKFTLESLGVDVDGDAIASDVFNAKRGDVWWQQYVFWITKDIAPEIDAKLANGSVVDKALGIDAKEPVNAQVKLNDAGDAFTVVAGQNGQGADASTIAAQAISSLKSLGATQPGTVTVTLDVTEPTVTDAIANDAKSTLDAIAGKNVSIKVAGTDIATVTVPMLASSMSVNANRQATLKSGETRSGYVVFDSAKLQQYYNDQIKPSLKLEREDTKLVVNNAGEVISTETEGHDGVVIADGADSGVGTKLADALASGSNSITVAGTVDPKQEVKVTHHVVIDLSDRKLYAYENDQVVRTLNVAVAQGNDMTTGECVGLMCTPTGDFTIWQKLPSQDMSGSLTLADGSVEKWDVKDVGFVNYFSHGGCAIHRIAGGYTADASMPYVANGSHGCVGIGWDVAEWFYNWCGMGTSVHVQV
ncbi:L,D-transpeptidase [Bifidobacterium olomucense]|uniref:L,D-transpeptidase catalytic domain-containing protein n=1 Tax=Bifidobacterium olomucense TaxID=2675324 RepID=A0A7Y0HWZ7_9BIFI|nr:L,D-transpeptidase [Bifidobacterium sp. DSM 109959]NMM97817.1 L,D-transpeptidase catalytic domain-containing protein [Bifidobacterium sp. DSM 109959]